MDGGGVEGHAAKAPDTAAMRLTKQEKRHARIAGIRPGPPSAQGGSMDDNEILAILRSEKVQGEITLADVLLAAGNAAGDGTAPFSDLAVCGELQIPSTPDNLRAIQSAFVRMQGLGIMDPVRR